jgi:hypothetical protein
LYQAVGFDLPNARGWRYHPPIIPPFGVFPFVSCVAVPYPFVDIPYLGELVGVLSCTVQET